MKLASIWMDLLGYDRPVNKELLEAVLASLDLGDLQGVVPHGLGEKGHVSATVSTSPT